VVKNLATQLTSLGVSNKDVHSSNPYFLM